MGTSRSSKGLAEDPRVNEYVRGAAIDTFEILVRTQVLSRDEVIDYFRYLFREGLERTPSFPWSSLVGAACNLYPREVMEEIREAFARGFVDPGFVSLGWVETVLSRGEEAARSQSEQKRSALIDDPVSELQIWACFQGSESEHWDPSVERLSKLALPRSEGWAEPAAVHHPKTGRNAPYPCKSGKKYKKCCGKPGAAGSGSAG